MKTLAILSGGMDSTVLAYHLAHKGDLVACLSVNYGQRHNRELVCAAQTASDLGVKHLLLDLSSLRAVLGKSSLTSDLAVPEGHYAEETMKATVVPNRNMILMALAVGAAITEGAEAVAYGAHAGDHAIYPDCRPDFAAAMAQAVELCDYNPPAILRPFITLSKSDIVVRGLALRVPFEQTWTCYKGQDMACGRCGTCVERLEAFNLAHAEDPLPYVDRDYWRTLEHPANAQPTLL